MDWVDRLNKAVNYIEEHLTEEIDYEKVARNAGCLAYHFQRMFGYMADVTLSEYIRRRRMTMAARDLQRGDEKVIDIAIKYGYASPTAFNRAFQAIHGIAPSLVSEQGISLKAYPPLSFRIIVKGAGEMNYKIEKKEAFRVVGMVRPLVKDMEQNFEEVPKFWNKVTAEGVIPRLCALMEGKPEGVLGINVTCTEEDSKYLIAVPSMKEVPEGMEEYVVPSLNWAVFSGEGECPKAIQETWQRVVTEWLPSSGYEYDNGPDLEVYFNQDPKHAKFEVWIPIVKK